MSEVRTDTATLAHLRHELRTPLNHIIGYSEMLLEDGTAAALEPGLRRLQQDGRKMVALVNDALSELHAGDEHSPMERVRSLLAEPVAAVVGTVAELQRQAVETGAQEAAPDLERIATAAEALLSMLGGGMSLQAAEAAGEVPTEFEQRKVEPGIVLLVDDNAPNRDMLSRRLTRDGHTVLTAEDGPQALALLAERADVELVLLDVQMPGMNGQEVLCRLKAEATMRHIPVLMLSASGEMETVVNCIQLGAEDYLPKPFDAVLLRARIGASLEKKRLRDREAEHLRELAEWNHTLEQRVADQVSLLERLGRLKRFFSPQLAELIVAGGTDDPLKTHRREVTVVFLDLRGFTSFAETAEPEEIMGVLREYHAEMGRLISEHEGTLERFTGDGMMIFFNDPVVVDNPAERAVRMAVAMRDSAAKLVEKWKRQGFDLALGVGVAKGYATIGAIGFEGRWDYGAIGSVTNLSARLCGEAKGGQVLVSGKVLTTLDGVVEVEPVGELSLKGFHKPVPTFNVLGLV